MCARLVGDAAGTVHSFRTHPRHENIDTFRVWFIADFGTQDSGQRRVRDRFVEKYKGAAPEVMLMGGDNAYPSGTALEYEMAVFNVYASLLQGTSVYSALGNHDAMSADSSTQSGQPTKQRIVNRRGLFLISQQHRNNVVAVVVVPSFSVAVLVVSCVVR